MMGRLRSLRTLLLLLLLGACSLSGGEASATGTSSTSTSNGPSTRNNARKAPHPSPLGTNLAAVRDWSTERPFADLFKQSRMWISNTESTWDDGRTLDLDARGWVRSLKPGQRARSLVMWGEPIPAGDYVVTWTGAGTVDFWPQTTTFLGQGRAIISADPKKGGVAVTIVATNEQDPIRDIHVFRKELEGKVWNPAFLEGLKAYSSLRFMDWMETNEPTVVGWADRAVVEDARWSVKGVPLEVMMDLANTLGADPWLTIPHTWDDDAVAKAAALVRERMRADLAVYVEHSNEVWNGMFPQAEQARKRGVARARAKDPFEAQLREHADRSVAIFQIWERAFAKDEKRLVRVMGAMAASPWASNVLLEDGDAAEHTDVLAIAPYFGNSFGEPGEAEKTRALSPDALFNALQRSVDDAIALVRQHKKVADKHGVGLVAYEGGQHLVGVGPAVNDDALTAILTGVNRDPRMKPVYLKYLQGWREAGGGLFVHYLDVGTYSRFGRWGARERLDQDRSQAPKHDALLTFVETTPVWW